jgi:hypothetical protein
MKRLQQPLYILLAVTLIFTACESSKNSGPEPVEAQIATDIAGSINTIFTPGSEVSDVPGDIDSTGGYTFYDLDAGTIIMDSSSAAWDIAFSQTTIIANFGNGGGIQLLETEFSEVAEAPTGGYSETLGGSGTWYTYNPQQFAILVDENETLIIQTPDGNYAKVEILSYYEGNPDVNSAEFQNPATRPSSRYFTFRYSLQTNGSTSLNFEEYWTYFDFETGSIVEDETSSQWDIAFQSTTLRANTENGGGLLLANIEFESFTEAPIEGYTETLGGSGTWYNYNPQLNAIIANQDVTLSFITGEGNYAKVKMLNYYQGNPDVTSADFINNPFDRVARYFTFEYAVQKDGSRFFE